MIRPPPGSTRTDSTFPFTTLCRPVAPYSVTAVNRFFGYAAIAGVRMTHGQVTPAAPVQPPAILKPVPAELGDSLRDIGDPELRTVLERMAAGLAAPPRLPKLS